MSPCGGNYGDYVSELHSSLTVGYFFGPKRGDISPLRRYTEIHCITSQRFYVPAVLPSYIQATSLKFLFDQASVCVQSTPNSQQFHCTNPCLPD